MTGFGAREWAFVPPKVSVFVKLAQDFYKTQKFELKDSDVKELHKRILTAFHGRAQVAGSEFKAFIQTLDSVGGPGQSADLIYRMFDQDTDGTVDLREILSGFAILAGGDNTARLELLFDAFDIACVSALFSLSFPPPLSRSSSSHTVGGMVTFNTRSCSARVCAQCTLTHAPLSRAHTCMRTRTLTFFRPSFLLTRVQCMQPKRRQARRR